MNIKGPWRVSTCIVGALLFVVCQGSDAHDGGFGHSRRTLFFDVAAEGFVLEYRITRSSDEALLELTLIDTDGDGQISPTEQQTYFQTLGNELATRFDVRTTTAANVRPQLLEHQLQPNLVQCFRYTLPTMATEILFVDRNFPHKPGVARILSGSRAKAVLAEPTDLNHAEQIAVKVSAWAGKPVPGLQNGCVGSNFSYNDGMYR